MNARDLIRLTVAALAVAGGLATGSATRAADDPVTHVSIVQSSDALGYSVNYIALDEGFYKKYNIDPDIQLLTGGEPESIAALHAGSAQFGVLTFTTAIQADARGEKLRAVAPFVREYVNQFIMNADAAKKAGITDNMPLKEKFARAKGMTVAAPDIGGGLQLLFKGLAKQYGFDADRDYNITAIKSFSGILLALKRGDIQIGLVAIPYGTIGVKRDGAVMMANFWAGAIPDFDGAHHEGMVTTADYAAKNPDVVARMHHAIADALAFMHAHPEKAAADIQKRFPAYATDLLHEFYVTDNASFAKNAQVDRHGYKLIQDFVANQITPSAASVDYDTFVLPIAQNKR